VNRNNRLAVLMLILALELVFGCGGGSQSSGSMFPPDISGSYTIILVGSSGGSATLHSTLKQSQWTLCNGNLICNGSTYINNLTGNFTLSWCNADTLNGTAQLFFTPASAGAPASPESIAFAVGDVTTSNNIFTASSSDFSKLVGIWESGPGYTCVPIPSGTLTWTAKKN
jgi:hypothetical protein